MRATNIKLFLFSTLIFASLNLFAQSSQQQQADSVFALIKKQFNAKHIDSIYMLTGGHFKKEVSLQAFSNISNFFALGPIEQSSFIGLDKNRIASYKLVFNSAASVLSIKADDNGKLDYIYFQDAVKLTRPASSNPLRSTMDKMVDSIARAYIQKANTVGLSIGIIKDGKISTYNYGETARGNNKLPDANTVFEIGSITKTFTAAILAYYVNKGKISLNDPITKYLPDSVAANPALQKIKIVNLSNHTSGLAGLSDNFFKYGMDPLNPYINYTRNRFFSDLKHCKLNSNPGDVYVYSNQAFGLLGIILERISGKTYEQLVKQIIAAPLKMNSTAQHLSPNEAARFAKVYDAAGVQTSPWDFDALAGCGCLRSTVNDVLLYAQHNMVNDNSILSKSFELARQITFSKGPQIGLAWNMLVINNAKYYWHNGGTGGSRSMLIFNPEKKIAVVVLSDVCQSTDEVGVNIIKKLQ